MKKINQSGFGAVEALLLILVLAVIGFAGFYVWHSQKKTAPAATVTTSSDSKATTNDVYAGWKSYSLKYEKLSFKYPAAWTAQDITGDPGLTPNTDSVILSAKDGFSLSIDDGWDGSGDPLNLAIKSTISVKFLDSTDYFVFTNPKVTQANGPSVPDTTKIDNAILMTNPSAQYSQNNTKNYFPQDKNVQANPGINNGGTTMLISAGYDAKDTKTFTNVDQAKADPEFKNAILVLESMKY